MHRRNSKKAGRIAFVAVLGVLAMASAAFACTSTMGQITIQGLAGTTIDGSSGSVTYRGDGTDFGQPSKGYCHGDLPTDRLDLANPTGPVTFQLTVAPYYCPDTQLLDRVSPARADVWEIRWIRAEDAIETDEADLPYPICHGNLSNVATPDNPVPWDVLGAMTIVDGTGDGSYSLLPSAMVGPGNICLERSPASGGEYATAPPIIFINVI